MFYFYVIIPSPEKSKLINDVICGRPIFTKTKFTHLKHTFLFVFFPKPESVTLYSPLTLKKALVDPQQ